MNQPVLRTLVCFELIEQLGEPTREQTVSAILLRELLEPADGLGHLVVLGSKRPDAWRKVWTVFEQRAEVSVRLFHREMGEELLGKMAEDRANVGVFWLSLVAQNGAQTAKLDDFAPQRRVLSKHHRRASKQIRQGRRGHVGARPRLQQSRRLARLGGKHRCSARLVGNVLLVPTAEQARTDLRKRALIAGVCPRIRRFRAKCSPSTGPVDPGSPGRLSCRRVANELAPGAVIAGRYRLDKVIGQGGMGVVWAAQHTLTHKRVALKFLRGPIHLRPELRRRFFREARAASSVVHPNVLEVHDVFELDDETPVMLMDLLEGETLGRCMIRQGALPLEEAASILVQAFSAVGTAHAAGVVHRDLKPENIFLLPARSGPPSVRVLDFGIAKLVDSDQAGDTGLVTGTGAILGTPCYMSPEQSYGERIIDHRADIWSLGAILYECLSGVRPIEGDSLGQVVKNLVVGGITPISSRLPSLPDDVVRLVERMLTREREERLTDLGEAQEVLLRYTAVRPPEFGPARSHGSDSSGGIPAPGSPDPNAKVRDGERGAPPTTHPSADTMLAPRSGPETAAAHTLTSPGATRRTGRLVWFTVPLMAAAAIGAAVVVGRQTTRNKESYGPPPSAVAPPTIVNASAAVVQQPVPAPTTSSSEPPAPSAPKVEAKIATSFPRTTAHRAGTLKTVPSAPPTAAPSAPSPPRERLGGLAEKPPF